jgi:hypothetical protein
MTIRRIVETNDDQILEVSALFDQFGQRTDEVDLAESMVIKFPDGTWQAGFVSTLAVHAVH